MFDEEKYQFLTLANLTLIPDTFLLVPRAKLLDDSIENP